MFSKLNEKDDLRESQKREGRKIGDSSKSFCLFTSYKAYGMESSKKVKHSIQ